MLTRFNAALAKLCMVVAVIGLLVIVVCVRDPGLRPLRPERHADLGRGAGAGAGAVGHVLGAAVGVRDAGHIGMESLLVLVSAELRRKLEIVIHVLVRTVRRHDGLAAARSWPSR